MPDQKSSKPSDYVVDYRRLPKATRFTAGNSGNPKGRAKGSKNLSTLFSEELAQTITLTENGKRKTMSKRLELVKQAVNKALNDPKAAALVFDQIRRCEELAPVQPVQQVKMNADEFEAIARRLLDEVCGAGERGSFMARQS
ncbi:MAG: DUF5681 domain-containing protein [Methylocella sp.]